MPEHDKPRLTNESSDAFSPSKDRSGSTPEGDITGSLDAAAPHRQPQTHGTSIPANLTRRSNPGSTGGDGRPMNREDDQAPSARVGQIGHDDWREPVTRPAVPPPYDGPETEGSAHTPATAAREALEIPSQLDEIVPLTDRPLDPKEASQKVLELSEAYDTLSESVMTLRQQLGAKDETIVLLEGRLKNVELQIRDVRRQCIANEPVPVGTLEQIADGIVRVTIIALLGGVVGGPLLALATKSLLGEKIIEGTVAAFVAAASTEIASRFADPTSHKHHD